MEQLLARYPSLGAVKEQIEAAREMILATYETQGKLLICGNGGSASDCEHIVGELMKSFKRPRPILPSLADALHEYGEEGERIANCLEGALPAISLCGHPSLSTAYANDREPDMVFAQQVNGFGKAGDLLISLTTSGNSQNCLYAAMVARAKGIKVLSITGERGGRIKALSDVCINLPEHETYLVQELTLPLYHYLCAAAEDHFFAD